VQSTNKQLPTDTQQKQHTQNISSDDYHHETAITLYMGKLGALGRHMVKKSNKMLYKTASENDN